MALLKVEGFGFSYGSAGRAVLDDVSFSVEAGEYVLLAGESGSGKTTLLRSLKTVLAPAGPATGRILFDGKLLGDIALREQAAAIGYVGQNVDEQLVCDTVGRELAFGLENLGLAAPVIRARVAEVAAYLGLEALFDRSVSTLSGGQKQLVNLAAVMVMRPQLLLLDEPCAQLDPLAGRAFIDAVGRLNRERAVAVIMVEHRAEEIFGAASRVLMLDRGAIAFNGAPEHAARWLLRTENPVAPSLPTATRIAEALDRTTDLPLDTGSGRAWFEGWFRAHPPKEMPARSTVPETASVESAIELRDVSFRYGRNLPDVLYRARLTVPAGGIHGIIGGNGSGKSTLMALIAGVFKPDRGRIVYGGEAARQGARAVAMLPQEPADLFAHDRLADSLDAACHLHGPQASARCAELVDRLGIAGMLYRNPSDLSAGELQRAALVLVLLGDPSILLLDEATRNLDAPGKHALSRILRELSAEGKTVVLSTHDLQFCAENAETAAMLFNGRVAAQAPVHELFSDAAFYTTNAAVITRSYLPQAITVGEAVAPWHA